LKSTFASLPYFARARKGTTSGDEQTRPIETIFITFPFSLPPYITKFRAPVSTHFHQWNGLHFRLRAWADLFAGLDRVLDGIVASLPDLGLEVQIDQLQTSKSASPSKNPFPSNPFMSPQAISQTGPFRKRVELTSPFSGVQSPLVSR
jgi:hypothetical protein